MTMIMSFENQTVVVDARGQVVDRPRRHVVGVEEDHEDLWELETVAEQAQAPMLRLEHSLHPWVAFLIVPLFALANAGVPLSGEVLTIPPDPIKSAMESLFRE